MPEFVLKQKTGLNDDVPFSASWSGFSAAEIVGQHVWWVGLPSDGQAAFESAVEADFGCAVPAANRFSEGKAFRIVSAGHRQFFIFGSDKRLPQSVGNAAQTTDQTDGWIGVRVKGSASREVFSRLCSLDFHPAGFTDGHAARAPFEGMLALIVCESAVDGCYTVHFQRSSARSFVGHLSHAATSVCGLALSGGH